MTVVVKQEGNTVVKVHLKKPWRGQRKRRDG